MTDPPVCEIFIPVATVATSSTYQKKHIMKKLTIVKARLAIDKLSVESGVKIRFTKEDGEYCLITHDGEYFTDCLYDLVFTAERYCNTVFGRDRPFFLRLYAELDL